MDLTFLLLMAETLIIYLRRGKPDKKADLKRQGRDRRVHGTSLKIGDVKNTQGDTHFATWEG